jgi:thiol-disulfide isomerase/thioredoxin
MRSPVVAALALSLSAGAAAYSGVGAAARSCSAIGAVAHTTASRCSVPRAAADERILPLPDIGAYRALIAGADASQVLIVEFSARECKACNKMKPKLASLARDWPEIQFHNALVEDGENKDWFKTHLDGQPIISVPHFEIIKAGSVLESFSCGAKKIDSIEAKLAARGIEPNRPLRRKVVRSWNRVRRFVGDVVSG